MKVYVDISVFTEDASVGWVSGTINVPIVPEIGDIVNLGVSKEGHIEEPLVALAHLKVTDRIITVDSETAIALTLDDLTLATRDDAEKVMTYFESRYGLTPNRPDD